ncbi:MAG: hypothetical protein JSS81_12970 [Acidobacteria bacterium]|nr:hypothetical protein [Acidobacteriota bacterium]
MMITNRTIKRLALLLGLFGIVFSSACSVPNLEAPECTDSRLAAKELYSYHFGNEMRFSPENLKRREKFITPELFRSLQNAPPDADPFTTKDTDFPKAFRIGGCQVLDPAKTDVEVLLFWKTDTRTEQRTIHVEVVKEGEKWLVNKILN